MCFVCLCVCLCVCVCVNFLHANDAVVFFYRTNNRLEGLHNGMWRKMENHPPFHRMVEAIQSECHRVQRLLLQAEAGAENVQIQKEADRQVRTINRGGSGHLGDSHFGYLK